MSSASRRLRRRRRLVSRRRRRSCWPRWTLAACGQSAISTSSGSASGDSSGGRNPDELVLAAVPAENAQSLQQDYQP